MNTITALLVGGPEHGKQWKIHHQERHIKIAVFDEVDYFIPIEEFDPHSTVAFHTEIYTKETLNFFGHFMSVFFHESLSDNGSTVKQQIRGHLLAELILNDTAKQLLAEGAS